VQPARLAPIVRGAISGQSNDGFVQRLQMAVCPSIISCSASRHKRPGALLKLGISRDESRSLLDSFVTHMSQMGQKAKYSRRADVFRFPPDTGHR